MFFQFVYYGYLFAYFACAVFLYYFDKFILNSYRLIIFKSIAGYAIFCSAAAIATPALSSYLEIVRYTLYLGFYMTAFIFGVMVVKIIRVVRIKMNKKFIAFGAGIFLVIIGQLFGTDILLFVFYNRLPPLLFSLSPFFPTLVTISGFIIIEKNLDFGFDIILFFYTAKKICIIHRGQITGEVQLCPKCLNTYCTNCFNLVIIPLDFQRYFI